jgi:hypothetical protein
MNRCGGVTPVFQSPIKIVIAEDENLAKIVDTETGPATTGRNS